ncbi:MAG TPA: Clp protease ClpP [Candidatus Paceibacterota bacterium]|nr:Clp protease ClpP [Candidatus Paceibacterota bacterium]
MEDEIKNITSNIEVFDNKIYLYEEIDQNTMFKLNKFIREMNYKLIALNPSKYMPGSKNDDHIELYIHSYGGSVLSAFATYDLISRNPIPIWTYVEGGAASAATLLSVAGAKRLITKTSYMLIHQLSSVHWGKFEELKDDMKNSENLMNRIKQIYRDKTKIPEKELDEILKHDLWLDAEKCLEWGLVDEVV